MKGKGGRSGRALIPTRGEGRRPESSVSRLRLAEPSHPIEQGGEGDEGENLGVYLRGWRGVLGSGRSYIPITRKNKPNVISLPRERILDPLSAASPVPLSAPSILPSSALRRDRSIELNPLNFIGHGRMTFR